MGDLGHVTDINVQEAGNLLATVEAPSSPTESNDQITPLPVSRRSPAATSLIESIAAYKRQLSSITTISNESTEAGLTNLSGELDAFEEAMDTENKSSKSTRPPGKRQK